VPTLVGANRIGAKMNSPFGGLAPAGVAAVAGAGSARHGDGARRFCASVLTPADGAPSRRCRGLLPGLGGRRRWSRGVDLDDRPDSREVECRDPLGKACAIRGAGGAIGCD
jgi:hypothetical protein